MKPLNIFDECKSYTFDNLYINLFGQMSRGQFPENIQWNNTTCELKNTEMNTSIVLSKEPTDAIQQLIEFFAPYCQTMAYTSISNVHRDSEDTGSVMEDVEWKKVKKENRERMISEYTQFIKNKYNLSSENHILFESRLNVALHFHMIDSYDIVIQNNKIVHIENIEFNEETKTFTFPKITFVDEKDGVATQQTSKLQSSIKKFLQYHSSRTITKNGRGRE
jgi:hypothetical protein